MRNYKAIIYDIDGTVLNTLNMNMYPLMKIIKEETGEDWTFEQVLKFAAYPGMKVMEELGVSDQEKTYARWVKYVNEYEAGATLYDGFDKVFETFDQKIIQAVVSAKTTKQYEIDFVDKGLDKYMEVAILADDTIQHKPDPEPIYECLRRLNIEAKDAIYIGDAYSDYLASQNAGIDFGYAKWGSVSSEGIIDPTYVFETPLELLQLGLSNQRINEIKIVMSDIDGTLLNSDEIVTQKTLEAIHLLKEKGYLFGLATGRPIGSVEALAKKWGVEQDLDIVLGLNGGHMKDYALNKEEKFYTIDGELIHMVVDHFKGYPVNFGVYVEDYLAVMYDDALAVRLADSDGISYKVVDFNQIYKEPQSKLIVICDPKDMKDVSQHGALLTHPDFKSLQAGKIEYEYMHPLLSKSFALEKMSEWHGVTMKQILAFGDADNDADMIRDAGIGVAMANGSDKTRYFADYITGDHNEDGIGEFLTQVFFRR
ncbi:MAG: Cof-type HAD-IIB family hydrolase [Coprobacillus sp.]